MEAKHIQNSNTKALEISDGVKVKILLRSADTNGVHAIFEDTIEPGASGPARHIHHKQDETFLFLKGEFELEVEGKRYRVKPGDVAFVPRGTAHGWKHIGNEIGVFRYIFSPALNIEDMFQDLHELRVAGKSGEDEMNAIVLKYPDQEVVGPPLS